MANKVTFQKLTEDIEKLNNEEQVEKSEGLQNAEFIEPAKEEPEKEPEKKEDEPEVKPEEESEPEKKEEPAEEPEAEKEEEPEEVEKSKGDKEEAEDEDKDAKAKKAAKNKSKKKEDEKVEKSEDSDDISGELIVKAFEELTKSNQSTNKRLDALEKSLSAFLEAFQADKLEKSKEEDKKEEEKKEEDKDEQKSPDEPLLAEDIEKSVKVEEAPEGKAVEYVQKSADGVAVPEETPEKEEEVEQPEQEPEFNARDHVSTVVDHYTKNAATLNRGEQNELKFAVQRVKRGAATEADVNLFKEIVESAKK
ncbi:hypothetical protein [Phage f2b1]|nr:hypothetical protein [Phage f2b1]